MWNQIFNPQNGFFQTIDLLFNLFMLSLIWAVLCIPVFTIGPATAALYYVLVKCIRRKEPYPFKNFLESFRANFKVGALASLVCALVASAAWEGVQVLWQAACTGSTAGRLMLVIYGVVVLLLLGTLGYLFPLLSRFSFGTKRLFLTAFQLALRHLPVTILLAVILAASIFVSAVFLFPVLFMPALTGLVCSLPLERVFRRYTPPEGGMEEGEDRPWYLR